MTKVCNYKPARDRIMGLDGYITECGSFQYFKDKEDMPEECLVCDKKIKLARLREYRKRLKEKLTSFSYKEKQ